MKSKPRVSLIWDVAALMNLKILFILIKKSKCPVCPICNSDLYTQEHALKYYALQKHKSNSGNRSFTSNIYIYITPIYLAIQRPNVI